MDERREKILPKDMNNQLSDFLTTYAQKQQQMLQQLQGSMITAMGQMGLDNSQSR